VQCYFVHDRCVPERNVSDDVSLGRGVPWTSRPLDEPSLGRGVPWPSRPLDEASLGRGVPWTRRPLDEASLGRGVPGMRRPLDDGVLKHWDRLSLCWVRVRLGVPRFSPGSGQIGEGRHGQGPRRPRDALSVGRNIRDFLFGDTSIGDTLSRHRRTLVFPARAANDQNLALCM
jgi:hypothetical protein